MIQVLNYSEEMACIMQHVFGRTLIVRNIDVGTRLAKSEGIDCVTLEGDFFVKIFT
jgi:structural maintenance of chromosome 3 (chondroitin sulfate proteoglycan 6)